jgi:hypothetical protein
MGTQTISERTRRLVIDWANAKGVNIYGQHARNSMITFDEAIKLILIELHAYKTPHPENVYEALTPSNQEVHCDKDMIYLNDVLGFTSAITPCEVVNRLRNIIKLNEVITNV